MSVATHATTLAQAREQLDAIRVQMQQFGLDLRLVGGRLEDVSWQETTHRERYAARQWWFDHITQAYARYQLDWPGPAAPIRGRVLCGAEAASCRCTKDAGHDDPVLGESADLLHSCDPEVCTGQWTGAYDALKWDGGSSWEPITAPRKVAGR